MLYLVFLADWYTTAEVSVGPLYLFTVAYAAWHLEKVGGTIASLLCTAIWVVVDWGQGHHFSQAWILWEQAGVRLCTYLTLIFFTALYRKTLEAHRRRLALLEQVLAVCPGCGRIGPQEHGWQRAEDLNKANRDLYQLCPVCTSTKQPNGPAHPARHQHA